MTNEAETIIKQAQARLDAWLPSAPLPEGGIAYERCAAEGYAYADRLLRGIAYGVREVIVEWLDESDIVDLGVVLMQAGDDLNGLYTWDKRDEPREHAFRVLDVVRAALAEVARTRQFNPPDISILELGIKRVCRHQEVGGARRRSFYTAVVVALLHPCARPCTLIVPADLEVAL